MTKKKRLKESFAKLYLIKILWKRKKHIKSYLNILNPIKRCQF